nr:MULTISPECIES: rifamycin-inactivating phosphotransferase [Actinoplanes]
MNLDELDRSMADLAGGKGAHLGELARIDGIRVPPGFVVTTTAFDRILELAPGMPELLDRLSALDPADREGIASHSAEIRRVLEKAALPDVLASAIIRPITAGVAYAVRSSATGEDSAATSFAGQHDTYLNVIGEADILDHVRRCWASLFAERAVTYRLRHGIGHRSVRMAVVIQRMIFPRTSGIMFTADPVTGNRRVTAIDAGFGLGEALVSGLVDPDVYQVRDGVVISERIAVKRLAVQPSPAGGVEHREVPVETREIPALSHPDGVRLEALGRRLEAHFGRPQDIEWCRDDDGFAIVQSRPITTLFPVPEAADDAPRVYLSVGHQQMMTEAITPLGLSVWKLTSPGEMRDAGGRLFVDATARLASPAMRAQLLPIMKQSDPLMGDAVQTVVDRGFVPEKTDDGPVAPIHGARTGDRGEKLPTDPAVVAELIAERRASLEQLKRDIAGKSGTDVIDFVTADLLGLRNILTEPRNVLAIMAGMEASWWLNEHLEQWLGEKNAADTLTLSVADNVTSEMGMALLDVADVLRAYPGVVDFLEKAGNDFLDRLPELTGGQEVRDAIMAFLDDYGMRCVGEIDITRPRWSEQPLAIVPLILTNVRNAEPGARARRVEQGRRQAAEKEREVLARLRELPDDGEAKAVETKWMIDRVRTFIGYREYPKYHMISRYFVLKQALLAEASRLVETGVLADRSDIFFLTVPELGEVVRTQEADKDLLRVRREQFRSFRDLRPPRVLTSEGEALSGSYQRTDLPAGALAGLPVSAGVVEGRARVVADIAGADLEPGDILVTAYTDPSWTPAFVTISGLVTEVGGQMTHGAVIAREYGLPAVVGVENATTLIRDGQRLRLHGTDGYLELL